MISSNIKQACRKNDDLLYVTVDTFMCPINIIVSLWPAGLVVRSCLPLKKQGCVLKQTCGADWEGRALLVLPTHFSSPVEIMPRGMLNEARGRMSKSIDLPSNGLCMKLKLIMFYRLHSGESLWRQWHDLIISLGVELHVCHSWRQKMASYWAFAPIYFLTLRTE